MGRSDQATTRGPKGKPAPCPDCGARGRGVIADTIQALVQPAVAVTLGDQDGFAFCRTEGCSTAYYRSDLRVRTNEVRVPIFQKAPTASTLVCYCFGHTLGEIQDEVRRDGDSEAPARITEACRQGLDRCETENPQGTCCLGNVRAVVRDAQAEMGTTPTDSHSASRWLLGGAVTTSALSSACCWLPLLAIGFGASVTSVAAFFEAYRMYFVGATTLLLAAGFYLVYMRKPACGPDGTCARPDPRLQRTNKIALWLATVGVVALALFPSYVGTLLGGAGSAARAEQSPATVSKVYRVEGMTCPSCAVTLERALLELEPVIDATVDYQAGIATLVVATSSNGVDEAVASAVTKAGYRVIPIATRNEGISSLSMAGGPSESYRPTQAARRGDSQQRSATRNRPTTPPDDASDRGSRVGARHHRQPRAHPLRPESLRPESLGPGSGR